MTLLKYIFDEQGSSAQIDAAAVVFARRMGVAQQAVGRLLEKRLTLIAVAFALVVKPFQ